MHPFALTTTRVLWTLCFASHLVLLIVLLGRERTRRFPFFTASIALMALRLLFEMLLVGRLSMMPLQSVLLTSANLGVLAALLVLIEVARQSLPQMTAKNWLQIAPLLALLSAAALRWWGPLPKAGDLVVHSQMDVLRFLQLLWQKGQLFSDLLTVGFCIVALCLIRRVKFGWRNHSVLILFGLTLLSAAWLGMTGYWMILSHRVTPGISREEYQHIISIGTMLYNGYRITVIVAAVWWIAALWTEEPTEAKAAQNVEDTASAALPLASEQAEAVPAEAPENNA